MFLTGLHKKILEGLTGAVILIDDTQKVCYLNPSAEMLLEISEKRLKDAHIHELFVEQDEQQSASISEAFNSGHPFTKREAELVLHSGSRVRVDYSASPYQDGKHHYMLLELQPRDRLLRISREEEMMAKQETTRILVRGLAHEIKNPLGGIRGAAQLLDRELDDGNLSEYTHIIIEEADRLRNLVDRMLGPNKLVKFKPTNIHEVLERVHNLISVESNSQIALMRDYDPSIPEFMGDQEQLIQAILNISRNAMEALIGQEGRTLPGTITLKTRTLRQFTIGHERHRLVCRLDIIDNGPGIPGEFIQNIFYPMVSGRAEGTGLGLSIAQSIIGQHKGLIECESEPGRTDFIIYIPLELT